MSETKQPEFLPPFKLGIIFLLERSVTTNSVSITFGPLGPGVHGEYVYVVFRLRSETFKNDHHKKWTVMFSVPFINVLSEADKLGRNSNSSYRYFIIWNNKINGRNLTFAVNACIYTQKYSKVHWALFGETMWNCERCKIHCQESHSYLSFYNVKLIIQLFPCIVKL